MTSRVAIHAHDWPIQVVAVDKDPTTGRVTHTEIGVVAPHSSNEHGFFCTDTRSLLVTEMKKPK